VISSGQLGFVADNHYALIPEKRIEGFTGISHSLATAPTIAQNREILEVLLVGGGEPGYIS